MIAPKLKPGDRIRIVTPSRSIKLPFITREIIELAENRLKSLGLVSSYGKHIDETNFLDSSSIDNRVKDLPDAFASHDICMIQTVIGGFNSGELLTLDIRCFKLAVRVISWTSYAMVRV
ncbi:MAG TPA: LD-carboxypeptidase [Candidatus Angelobacter sp.]|nr:LD-carboxypeptidase [Candidatus Angelobacter sp.]